ncbi:MAG: LacI family DNA-binding transcriptional regulator [Saccharofermentanales bacterium]|jgi:DNA-binding LacI/PurR family transcriptional regulator
MSITQTDIAKLAEVSVSTVSRALSNDTVRPVNPKTRKKIIRIARSLGYYRIKGIQSIEENGNLVCFLASEYDTFADLFFSNLLLGVQNQAELSGYKIIETFVLSREKLTDIMHRIKTNEPDGIILMGRISKPIMEEIKAITDKVVYAGLNRVNSNIDEVICDAYRAIEQTVTYLINLGFKKIGFIGTIPDINSDILNEHRFAAYRDTLYKNNIKLETKYCRNIPLDVNEAYRAASDLINSGNLPEAICCANDNVAIAVIKALHDNNYKVPQDISITGIDDIETAKYFQPSLTTSHMHNKEIGELAVRLLHDRLTGRHEIPLLVELPSKLMIRDSCMVKS